MAGVEVQRANPEAPKADNKAFIKNLAPWQPPQEAQDQRLDRRPDWAAQENQKIKTSTNPTVTENAADLAQGIGSITAPLQATAGIVLIPFSAGLSAALLGGAWLDYASNGEAASWKRSEKNKRMLREAAENGHEIKIIDKKGITQTRDTNALTEDSSGSNTDAGQIALKGGNVDIKRHDPETGVTEVEVLYEALPHEATVFASKPKDAKKDNEYALAA